MGARVVMRPVTPAAKRPNAASGGVYRLPPRTDARIEVVWRCCVRTATSSDGCASPGETMRALGRFALTRRAARLPRQSRIAARGRGRVLRYFLAGSHAGARGDRAVALARPRARHRSTIADCLQFIVPGYADACEPNSAARARASRHRGRRAPREACSSSTRSRSPCSRTRCRSSSSTGWTSAAGTSSCRRYPSYVFIVFPRRGAAGRDPPGVEQNRRARHPRRGAPGRHLLARGAVEHPALPRRRRWRNPRRHRIYLVMPVGSMPWRRAHRRRHGVRPAGDHAPRARVVLRRRRRSRWCTDRSAARHRGAAERRGGGNAAAVRRPGDREPSARSARGRAERDARWLTSFRRASQGFRVVPRNGRSASPITRGAGR